MGCGTGLLKCILVVINIIFAIIGMLFLGIGVYFEYFANDELNSKFADIISNVPGLSSLANVADAASSSGSQSIDFAILLNPITIALIVVGAVVGCIAIIGCIGACCGSRCFIIIYCILMAFILVAQVVLVGLFFGGVLKPYIESYLQGVIDKDYVGIDDTGLYSLAFNFVMVEMECCGLNSYSDFATSTSWKRQRLVTVGGANINVNLTTPVACCKFVGTFPSVTIVNDVCAMTPTDTISNWKTGCWNASSDRLNTYKTISIGVLAGVLVVQFIILLFGVCIARSFEKDSEEV